MPDTANSANRMFRLFERRCSLLIQRDILFAPNQISDIRMIVMVVLAYVYNDILEKLSDLPELSSHVRNVQACCWH